MKYLLFLLLIFYYHSIDVLAQKQVPDIKNGILDLRNYNFNQDKSIKLDGTWQFVYDKWLLSDELNNLPERHYIDVPNVWNGFDWKNQKLPGQGIATYRLKILLNHKPPLALKVPSPSTAYNLYLNGKLKIKEGIIGKNYQDTQTSNRNRILEIYNPADTLDIIIHIANFHHRKGGIWSSLDLGKKEAVYKLKENNLLFDVFLVGSLLIMAFYYLAFFVLRTKDASSIYFSLFCFVVFFRILSVRERLILEFIPWLSWELTTKLEYITFYLALASGAMFIKSLYPREYSRWIQIFVMFNALVASLVTVFTPSIIHSNIVPYFQIIVIVIGLYTVAVLTLAAIRKREGAWIFVLGFLVVITAIINDILHYTYIINTFESLPLGVFVFFFAQSVVLSQKFSRTFTKVENLTHTLSELNKNLEKKVVERTQKITEQKAQIESQHQDLIKVNKNITASMNYAQRIQKSILPKEEEMRKYFKDLFILYRPRDIVSGDFYWFSKPTEDITIIAAADCTGHGIPGGFMSMIGNDLLEEIVALRSIYEPAQILQELKARVNEVLKQKDTGNQDGMDISICTIEHYSKQGKRHNTKARLSYAGANNPVIYFQNGEMGRLKANRIMIGGYNPLEKESVFTTKSIDLEQDTRVYLFSDGYHDQFGGANKRKFMRSRFRDLLSKIHQESMEKQRDLLEKTLLNWMENHKQIDDVLVIGLEL